MKIALFSGAGTVRSAAATYTAVLKSGLEKSGHQVVLATADPSVDDCFSQDGSIYCPAKVTPSLYGMSVRVSLLGPMENMLNKFRPDVVHVVTLDEMGLAGLKYAQRRHLPLVTTVHNLHDAMEGYGTNKAYDNLAKMKVRSTVRKILTESDVVCSPSAQTQSLLEELDIHCKVQRSPFCINLSNFRPTNASDVFKKRLGIQPGTTCFAFAGRLLDDCGLDTLLDLWKSAAGSDPSLQLLVVGSGPEAARFGEQAKDLALDNQVTFVGELSQHDLNDCFACCRAFVSGSVSPAVKASPLEAQAAGLPVILSQSCANSEFVRDGVNGFTYDSPERFSEVLHLLAQLDGEGEVLLRQLVSKSAINLSDKNLAMIMADTYASAKRKFSHKS
ncbi:MAG: glycosyltransferase [Oscillospiraceae bacterium]|jgi:1,2-diacylglycerol 3-alpha-glucosyltransferase|nr:glycosyltransferase [Oscillospiraceae bacterium]MDD3260689.1 glycosyltransferase [Oscillospiraceae bacterium]